MTKQYQQAKDQNFSPREFLRARRPERFSDSVVEERPLLDRAILEYHIETLTSRSQETDFENFARRLAERNICPNLIPHTGPTGGGDSKVDTETFPVSDRLSYAWYTGIGREAAEERWAFAFSAKKDWRGKVRADIAKIAATQRGYRRAFFISSQYIADRVRAEIEDELRTTHKLDVRILDRSWILDRVFLGGMENVAIDELKLSTALRKIVRKGPLDLQREQDLEEIEARIKDSSEHGRFGMQFVADCIEAAEVSRGLDRPRQETEGKFLRARRAAEEHGNSHQCLVAVYQQAWTAYWWYEDFKSFLDLYSQVEKYAIGSENVYDLELLMNLWTILHALVRKDDAEASDVSLDDRTHIVVAELERIMGEPARPSAALQARALRLQMSLQVALVPASPQEIDNTLHDLRDVVRQCSGLVGFPFEPLVDVLTEVGQVVGDRPAYEELFETLLSVSAARDGDVSAARLLYKRGVAQLRRDKPYDAIRTFGRALVPLYKHESRHDLVKTLYLCGAAYERVGLLWAARGSLVTAASIATNEFWTYADVTEMQAECCSRMKWLELQLGRVPHALAWHEIDRCVKRVLVDQGYTVDFLMQGELEFSAILGILFLKADVWQLKQLSCLPDVLDGLGLNNSAVALRFALGYEDDLPKGDTPQDRHEFFVKWRGQPAAEDIPDKPSLYECRTVTLESRLLGCQIVIESENGPVCILLAESMLAALESLLATGLTERLVAREPILRVTIRKSDFVLPPFSFELAEPDGTPHLLLKCGDFDSHSMSSAAQGEVKGKLLECLSLILVRVFLLGDPEAVATKLFRDEHADERALNFTGSFVTLGNVLGRDPKTSITAWSLPNAKEYPLRRWEEWDSTDRKTNGERTRKNSSPEVTTATNKSPVKLLDTERLKHTEVKTVSLIREALWNRAKWSGTVFLWDERFSAPPILALLFRDPKAAGQIFSNWRKEFGQGDRKEFLRISIVRHMQKTAPHSYRIVIGVNPTVAFAASETKQAFMISRINTMEPNSDYNLTKFLKCFHKFGQYFLGYAILQDGQSQPQAVLDSCIGKRELYVREAWEIGRHDPDCIAIQKDDDPIIPSGQENVPVLEAIRWLRDCASGTSGDVQ
ncbi:MAG: hypothetical protein PHW60_03635 [Kiritimatiellae bacterium]|nr:hypothetical protein [Kiritimatiellia bacterium]